MAGQKISDMPTKATLDSADRVPIVSAVPTGRDANYRFNLYGLTQFTAPGTGGVARSNTAKFSEIISVKDYGAVGDGVADDTAAILAAAVAVRSALTDGLRALAGEIKLPPGRYRITGPIDLAPASGVAGLTISGSGGTEVVLDGPTATITCSSSRSITFRGITFRSIDSTEVTGGDPYGIDLEQNAFTINQAGNPLRTWKFEGCIFAGFFKCFYVTGASMCSEFYFDTCKFSNCYILMDNYNNQAVNWNFANCDWENSELDTVKSKSLSTPFRLQKGTFASWFGGSFVSYGPLVYFNLTASEVFEGNSHSIKFDGVRIERLDDAGTTTPLFDRPEGGTYVVPGNAPKVSLVNVTVLSRGAIPVSVVHFKVWDNVCFSVDSCDLEPGKITGVYGALSGANTGELTMRDSTYLPYEDIATGKVSDHIKHSITISNPKTSGATLGLAFQQRSDSLTLPYSLSPLCLIVCGPTGSLPNGGTTVNLPTLTKYSRLLRLFVRRWAAATNALTVQLRDQADTTTYGEAILASGADRVAYGEINLELGFQLPTTTPLMLKFVGTAEVVKGIAGLEYL